MGDDIGCTVGHQSSAWTPVLPHCALLSPVSTCITLPAHCALQANVITQTNVTLDRPARNYTNRHLLCPCCPCGLWFGTTFNVKRVENYEYLHVYQSRVNVVHIDRYNVSSVVVFLRHKPLFALSSERNLFINDLCRLPACHCLVSASG